MRIETHRYTEDGICIIEGMDFSNVIDHFSETLNKFFEDEIYPLYEDIEEYKDLVSPVAHYLESVTKQYFIRFNSKFDDQLLKQFKSKLDIFLTDYWK